MADRYEKKESFQFCRIRNTMVRLEVIQATVGMPDLVRAEMKLMPVGCNRSAECKRQKIRCIVYDRLGEDPCPEAWE